MKGLAALVIALAAAALWTVTSNRVSGEREPMAAATLRAVGPLDLATVPESVAGHYHFAAEHRAEFEQIPCWCGCEQFLGHRHLADCFVRADGRGWEAHAAGCGVCIGEAVVAERLLGEGRTPAEVKAAVDVQFGPTVITAPAAAP